MTDPNDLRVQAHIGLIQSVDDTQGAQTALLKTHDGVTRADVEVMQPFGFASNPPGDGAIAVMIAIGGDAGQFVALPGANPSNRMGGLAKGEVAVYTADGSRVHLKQGGAIEIHAGNAVTILVPAMTVTAPSGVTINGPLHVTGPVTCDADVSDSHGSLNRLRGHYDAHQHGGGPTTSQTD